MSKKTTVHNYNHFILLFKHIDDALMQDKIYKQGPGAKMMKTGNMIDIDKKKKKKKEI